MAGKRITKRSVDALRCPPDRDRVFLWDSDLKGFGVAAMPSGTKVYVAQYRQSKRQRRMKLGEHGRLTPDEARSAAKAILGAVEGGKDPIEEKRVKRSEQSFKALSDSFMARHVALKCKGRTADAYETMLRLHILPALGSKSVSQVTRADIARLHSKMAKTPAAANRCVALIDSVWNWGVDSGEISALPLPTKDLELYPEEERDRYLTIPEMKRLGAAMHDAETVGLPWDIKVTGPKARHLPKKAENQRRLIDADAVAAIRLLVLTGARLREILHARWEWVDLDRGIMFLPDSKARKKPIYLSTMALHILEGITRVQGNPHIFPGERKGTHRSDLKRPWLAIRRAAGLLEDEGDEGDKSVSPGRPRVRLHDLRHSFASVGAGSSMGLPMIGKLLGHKTLKSTNRYAHLDTDPIHKSANLIGTQISAALAPTKR